MVRVKICGITNVKDARNAARLGADALGFNFFKGSPRYIRPERAKAIIAALPPLVLTVGVFVDEEPERILEICAQCGLDAAQMHGDEPPRLVHAVTGLRRIKALRIADAQDVTLCRRYRVDAYLLDAKVPGEFGGTGKTFNWELAREAAQFGPIILAGGLTPANVAQAVAIVQPYAVDTASGVEDSPGEKNKELMAQFIRNAKAEGLARREEE
jgi:phosphoribosylanthranilate isomerase